MPDPTKETVSASQVPALFNLSPWCTRHMLYQEFVHDIRADKPTEGMEWGKRMQSVILDAVAEELHLNVTEHVDQTYMRHPDLPIGCTPDGWAVDPQLGVGWVEAKNVSEWAFMDEWTDTEAPLHVELQLQAQMMVPRSTKFDDSEPIEWGVIAALVGGNRLVLYRRKPEPETQAKIVAEAALFLEQCARRNEPPMLGKEIELPGLLAARGDELDDEPLDRTADEFADGMVAGFVKWRTTRLLAEKGEDAAKAWLAENIGNAPRIITKNWNTKATRIKTVREPGMTHELRDALDALAGIAAAPRIGIVGEVLRAWFNWLEAERTFSRSIKFDPTRREEPVDEADLPEPEDLHHPLEAG